MGDNELNCQSATLSTVCGEDEMKEDLQGVQTAAMETPPELKECGSEKKQRKRSRYTSTEQIS